MPQASEKERSLGGGSSLTRILEKEKGTKGKEGVRNKGSKCLKIALGKEQGQEGGETRI